MSTILQININILPEIPCLQAMPFVLYDGTGIIMYDDIFVQHLVESSEVRIYPKLQQDSLGFATYIGMEDWKAYAYIVVDDLAVYTPVDSDEVITNIK
jgi:hypothetical protein